MDQNDSTHRTLVVDSGSGICRVGFAGFPRAVFLFVCQAQDAPHLAGINQRDSYAVGWFCWYCTSRFVPSCRLQATDACHHSRYGPEGAVRGAVQKTAEIPQLQFITVVDISFVVQRLIAMVLATIEFPQLRVETVVDALILQVVQISCHGTKAGSHGPDSLSDHTSCSTRPCRTGRADFPCGGGEACPTVQTVRRTIVIPQLQ